MSVQGCSGRELLEPFSKGCPKSFDQLIRCYDKLVYSLAFYLTGSAEQAEDILGEVFVAAWEQRAELSTEQQLRFFLLEHALEASTRYLEAREYSLPKVSVENTNKPVDDQAIADYLEGVILELPFEYRKVFVLRDVIGLEISEISELLSLSEKDSRTRLQRARLIARSGLPRDGADPRVSEKINAYEENGAQPEFLV